MTRIERLGMELAEDIRREAELSDELSLLQQRITERMQEIRETPPAALYESTSEQTLVRPFIPTVGAEDAWPCVDATVKLMLPEAHECGGCYLVAPGIRHSHGMNGEVTEYIG